MPELPEVESVRQNISSYLIDQTITIYSINEQAKLFNGQTAEIKSKLNQQKVQSIDRIGKHLLINLINEYTLYIHLGMSGQLYPNKEVPIDSHIHLVLQNSSGHFIIYRDPRRFGKIAVYETIKKKNFARLKNIGIDALEISFDNFYKKIQLKNRPVKVALLDQAILAGVGNIYADESLFLTGILPTKKTKDISKEKYQELLVNINKVLNLAIAAKGSSVTYFIGGDEHQGNFQNQLNVYARAKEPCKQCQTPIKKIKLGGRGTHFCPICQL